MSVQLGQYPPARHVVAHFSDPHLLDSGADLYGAVPSDDNLAAALAQLEESDARPEAIVFTGDLADRGEPDAYRRLRAAVEPVAERLGSTLVWLMGNHDEREPMRSVLLDEAPTDGPIDRVWNIGGLRIIGLDSSVPGYHHGELSDDQLGWLDAQLAAPAPDGTIIGLHHPPIPAPQPMFDVLELRGQSRLADVVRGRDVRCILGGHLHYSAHSTFAGIPVSVAAATCYTMNLSRPQRTANGMLGGQAFNLVYVYDETVVHHVVPLGDHTTFDAFDEAFIQRLESLDDAGRIELFSRKR